MYFSTEYVQKSCFIEHSNHFLIITIVILQACLMFTSLLLHETTAKLYLPTILPNSTVKINISKKTFSKQEKKFVILKENSSIF